MPTVTQYTVDIARKLALKINTIPERDIIYEITTKKEGLYILFSTRKEGHKYWPVCFQFDVFWGSYKQDCERMSNFMENCYEVWSAWALEKENTDSYDWCALEREIANKDKSAWLI